MKPSHLICCLFLFNSLFLLGVFFLWNWCMPQYYDNLKDVVYIKLSETSVSVLLFIPFLLFILSSMNMVFIGAVVYLDLKRVKEVQC